MLESENLAHSPTVLFDEVNSPTGEMTSSVHTVAKRAKRAASTAVQAEHANT